MEMESGSGFVEDEHRRLRGFLAEIISELHALIFTAGEG